VTIQLLAVRVIHKVLKEYLQAVHDTLTAFLLHDSNKITIVLYGHEMKDNFSEKHSNFDVNFTATRRNSFFQTQLW
jgi:hypothetical protein